MSRVQLVRRVRAAHCMTQDDLARWMGFNTRPWQRKEQGTSPIRDSEIYALAAFCSGIGTIEEAQAIIEKSCKGSEEIQARATKGRKK